MLEIVPNLVERIIKLVEIRQKASANLFNNHIEPIYRDLRVVHEDFRKLLIEAREGLEQGRDPKKFLLELRRRREDRLTLRRDIRRYIHLLPESFSGNRDMVDMFRRLALKLLLIAPSDNATIHSRADSPVFVFLDAWATLVEESESEEARGVSFESKRSEELLEIVSHTLERVDQVWGVFANSYYALRVECLK